MSVFSVSFNCMVTLFRDFFNALKHSHVWSRLLKHFPRSETIVPSSFIIILDIDVINYHGTYIDLYPALMLVTAANLS